MNLRATTPNGRTIDYVLQELSEPHVFMLSPDSGGTDIYPLSWKERGFVVDDRRTERFTHSLITGGGVVFYGCSEGECFTFLRKWRRCKVEVLS